MFRSTTPEGSDSDVFYTPPTSPCRSIPPSLPDSSTDLCDQTAISAARLHRQSPEVLRVNAQNVKRGQILFLAKDGEAYRGVQCDIPEGIKGHFVLVLERFPSKFVWALVVRAALTSSRAHDLIL